MGNSFSRDKRKRRVFDEEQACAHLHSMNAESRHSFESAHDAKMRLAGNTSEKSWTEKIDSHAERAGAEYVPCAEFGQAVKADMRTKNEQHA